MKNIKIMLLAALLAVNCHLAYAVPLNINYAGNLSDNGQAIDGPVFFKFAIVDTAGNSVWSNDATSDCTAVDICEPSGAIQHVVSNGMFNMRLGDTTVTNMTMPLSESIFTVDNLSLKVWYSRDAATPFTQLNPDRRLASTPYAFVAGLAKGLSGSSIVTEAMLQDQSVTTAKITDKTISAADIADGAATADIIAAGAITDAHIAADAAISASKLGAGINADTIDNLDSTAFIRSSGGTITGGLSTADISAGNVTASGYALTLPETRYLAVPGTAFMPVISDTVVEPCFIAANGVQSVAMKSHNPAVNRSTMLYATVYLPHRAVIKSIGYSYYRVDPASSNTGAVLYRGTWLSSVGSIPLGSVLSQSTENGSTNNFRTSPLVTPELVNYQINSYSIEVDLVDDVKFCLNAVRLEYTVSGF